MLLAASLRPLFNEYLGIASARGRMTPRDYCHLPTFGFCHAEHFADKMYAAARKDGREVYI